MNVSAVCGSLDSEAAAAAAVRRSDCAAARCHGGTARVRQLSTRQDLAGREPAEVTVHLADCQWRVTLSDRRAVPASGHSQSFEQLIINLMSPGTQYTVLYSGNAYIFSEIKSSDTIWILATYDVVRHVRCRMSCTYDIVRVTYDIVLNIAHTMSYVQYTGSRRTTSYVRHRT